jgi:hypothetical protein
VDASTTSSRISPPGVGELSRRFGDTLVSIFKGISVDITVAGLYLLIYWWVIGVLACYWCAGGNLRWRWSINVLLKWASNSKYIKFFFNFCGTFPSDSSDFSKFL